MRGNLPGYSGMFMYPGVVAVWQSVLSILPVLSTLSHSPS